MPMMNVIVMKYAGQTKEQARQVARKFARREEPRIGDCRFVAASARQLGFSPQDLGITQAKFDLMTTYALENEKKETPEQRAAWVKRFAPFIGVEQVTEQVLTTTFED